MKKVLIFILMMLLSVNVFYAKDRVDSIMKKMSLHEKVAQIFIVGYSSRYNQEKIIEIEQLIKKEKIGGLIVMFDDIYPSIELANHFQSVSKLPLLMTIDAEWGVAMRFDKELTTFPRQMQLGALSSDDLIYKMGKAMAEQCIRTGFQVNFAPDVDVNNNPNNPVINTRSFGEDKEKVARYASSLMHGLQDGGVFTSAKHFPGHGDTDADSHTSLPVLRFSKERLDSLELYPFRKMIKEGVDMIMIGHLDVPSYDSTDTPSSLSYPIITELLRNKLGYDGIIITDALGMQGVATHLNSEEISLAAYKAGCDFILMPNHEKESIKRIVKAIRRGEISRESLDMRVRKMLELKLKAGLFSQKQVVDTTNIINDLESPEILELMNKIAEQSITMIKAPEGANSSAILPMIRNSSKSCAFVGIGDVCSKELAEKLTKYQSIDTAFLRNGYTIDDLDSIRKTVSDKDYVIISIHNTDQRPLRHFGLDQKTIDYISAWSKEQKIIFVYMGSPYAFELINHKAFDSIIIGYTNTLPNCNAVAEILEGEIPALGVLPVRIGDLPAGSNYKSNKVE
ncbi:MAG: hypothetical protein M0R23_08545 [Bacteroidales bacterium]|nr:hypothetical protein [Bacteroidales bacterium]